MADNLSPSPAPKAPVHSAESGDVQAFRAWIDKNGTPVFYAVLTAIVVILACTVWQNRRRAAAEAATQALFTTQDPDALLAIADDAPSSTAAPLAILQAAENHGIAAVLLVKAVQIAKGDGLYQNHGTVEIRFLIGDVDKIVHKGAKEIPFTELEHLHRSFVRGEISSVQIFHSTDHLFLLLRNAAQGSLRNPVRYCSCLCYYFC